MLWVSWCRNHWWLATGTSRHCWWGTHITGHKFKYLASVDWQRVNLPMTFTLACNYCCNFLLLRISNWRVAVQRYFWQSLVLDRTLSCFACLYKANHLSRKFFSSGLLMLARQETSLLSGWCNYSNIKLLLFYLIIKRSLSFSWVCFIYIWGCVLGKSSYRIWWLLIIFLAFTFILCSFTRAVHSNEKLLVLAE